MPVDSGRNFAHRSIAVNFVYRFSILAQFNLQVVEVRVVRTPEMLVLNCQTYNGIGCRCCCRSNYIAISKHLYINLSFGCIGDDGDSKFGSIYVGYNHKILDIVCRDGLKPDCLPDT